MARRKRTEKKRILICTEGTETEPQYIESLIQALGTSGESVSVSTVGVGKDPLKIVEKCVHKLETAKNPFDMGVCLIDLDQHATLNSAIKLAENHGIEIVVSNLKFEVWLLWHVSSRTAFFGSKQLDRMMTENKILENGKHLSTKFPVENYPQACAVAYRADPELKPGRRGPNSSTSMPWLIDLLTGKNA
ncbi:hypothetical protein CQ018_12320 [Arthrobacter sp. MYb227]|uniref:RloB family protein n=1 Tax=Arthrobacter sp. MYb227 TaxID=1848601 RepID=UPI000CFBE797|nr:RloB family protein [Arthrobacter sp. MYb227]PQZ92283.1 hypothetical protein CQ018_12320 [Arthrobacter sp. MYb227]